MAGRRTNSESYRGVGHSAKVDLLGEAQRPSREHVGILRSGTENSGYA